MTERLHQKLDTLRDRLSDARDGYEQALSSVDDSALKALFERAAADKALSLAEVERLMPVVAGEAGSIVGPITKGIVYVRSAITGDASLLPGMIDGEKRVQEACADARAAAVEAPEISAALAAIERREAGILVELEAANAARG